MRSLLSSKYYQWMWKTSFKWNSWPIITFSFCLFYAFILHSICQLNSICYLFWNLECNRNRDKNKLCIHLYVEEKRRGHFVSGFAPLVHQTCQVFASPFFNHRQLAIQLLQLFQLVIGILLEFEPTSRRAVKHYARECEAHSIRCNLQLLVRFVDFLSCSHFLIRFPFEQLTSPSQSHFIRLTIFSISPYLDIMNISEQWWTMNTVLFLLVTFTSTFSSLESWVGYTWFIQLWNCWLIFVKQAFHICVGGHPLP